MAKTTTTGTTAPKEKLLPGPVRAMLLGWTVGVYRDKNDVLTGYRKTGIVTHGMAKRLVDEGYVSEKLQNPGQSWSVLGYTRLDKEVQAYKPRGASPKHMESYRARSPFPWPVQHHWKLVQASTNSAVRGITKSLSSEADDWAGRNRENNRLQMLFPRFVHTKTELTNLRDILLSEFSRGQLGGNTRTSRYAYWPRPAQYLFPTGVGLHMILMELLVEPEYDGNGKFVRFIEVHHDRAFEEIKKMTFSQEHVADKYLTFKEGNK